MLVYLMEFFFHRHNTTKHLLRKQNEIRLLRKEIEQLKQDKLKMYAAFNIIHAAMKEHADDYIW